MESEVGVMAAYIVKQIYEADFGCEGMPDGSKIQAQVLLRSEDSEEISVMIPDRKLYDKGINEGDWVHFDVDGNIMKE